MILPSNFFKKFCDELRLVARQTMNLYYLLFLRKLRILIWKETIHTSFKTFGRWVTFTWENHSIKRLWKSACRYGVTKCSIISPQISSDNFDHLFHLFWSFFWKEVHESRILQFESCFLSFNSLRYEEGDTLNILLNRIKLPLQTWLTFWYKWF